MKTNFGYFLRKVRKERKMSLREVERKAKISNAYLSQLERGARTIPTISFLARLASVYGIDIDVLIGKAVEEIKNDIKKDDNFYKKMGKNNVDIPAPDMLYIMKYYELLTENGKKHLSKYLQFLLENQTIA
jgi:transcriptional regulator with XRE-family HTH domain